ncbi:MAG: tetratricopeptide repeat protein, partial [Cyanobium sp.]
MIRSSRRGLIALLLLPWQAVVFTPGVVAALEAASLPLGDGQHIAQTTMPMSKEIPADVQGWFDAMKEQADKGNGAEALRMHERVMAWARANLPEKHVFRARVMVRYGYVLASMEKHQEALAPTLDGSQMLRVLSKGK